MANIDFQIPAVLTLVTKEENGKKKRYFNTTASSTVMDAHEDEFTPRAVEKMARQAHGSGMSIFLNHEYRIPEDLFGTTTEAHAVKRASDDGSELITDMDLSGFINEANPRARETADALEGGAKLGVSIGARIKDYRPRDEKDPLGGWIIDDVELKEASIVGMPANPRTWVHYATKAINGFERERVKEAADMNMTATEVASLPADDSILEEDSETLDLIGTVEVDKAKVLTTETMPGGEATMVDGEEDGQPTFDGDPDTDEDVVEAADEAAAEEPAQESESPAAEAESETPAEVLASALNSSVEELSMSALRQTLKIAKDELTARDELIAEVTKERDAALDTLTEATAILNRLATTPLGRKAVYTNAVKDYRSRITGVYDPEFMKFLKGPESK